MSEQFPVPKLVGVEGSRKRFAIRNLRSRIKGVWRRNRGDSYYKSTQWKGRQIAAASSQNAVPAEFNRL